jgi:hypothetical protein
MEGDERPQKMRKLSHDHEESQVEVETAKNVPDAANGNGEVQQTTGDDTIAQENLNQRLPPCQRTLCVPMVLWPQMLKILLPCQRTS